MTPILAFANHKGGSGKTTSAYYIAEHWGRMGISTLAIDLDSQGTLSGRMVSQHDRDGGDPTIADMLAITMTRGDMNFDDCILVQPYYSVICADHRLGWVAAKMQTASPNHNILQRAIRQLANHFDAVIIDCPPSADIVIVNALVAATHVVICATPTPESWDGQERMRAMIEDLRESVGQAPQFVGIIATQSVERANLHRMHIAKMDPDLIGAVPMRVGVDQDFQLRQAYGPIAEHLAIALELQPQPEAVDA
jgi:chromosome partitioning protein